MTEQDGIGNSGPGPINLNDIQTWLANATGIEHSNKQLAFMVISMVSAYNQFSREVTVKGLEVIKQLIGEG